MCAATYIHIVRMCLYLCLHVTRRRKHNYVVCMCLNFVLVYILVCACAYIRMHMFTSSVCAYICVNR